MAVVRIKCPLTLHGVSTGVELKSDVGFHSLLDITYHLHCPLCGNTHPWTKRDAWIGAPHPWTKRDAWIGAPEPTPEPIPPSHPQATDYSTILKEGWLHHY
jgi:hypothetical protein